MSTTIGEWPEPRHDAPTANAILKRRWDGWKASGRVDDFADILLRRCSLEGLAPELRNDVQDAIGTVDCPLQITSVSGQLGTGPYALLMIQLSPIVLAALIATYAAVHKVGADDAQRKVESDLKAAYSAIEKAELDFARSQEAANR